MSIIDDAERMLLKRGKTKLVSFLIPSRKRFDNLLKTCNSIAETATDVSRVEILIRFDIDDIESVPRIAELPFDKVDIYVIVGERFRGYIDLNKYINECCSISRGDFLFLFNDDTTMASNGWDEVLTDYMDDDVVLNPSTADKQENINTFPIISRRMYEAMGHFSLQAHNDTWVSEVGSMLGIEKVENRIKIFHDRPSNPKYTGSMDTDEVNRETWDERTEMFRISRPEFDQPKFCILRQEDAFKIKEIMK
tara:strand:- start:8222 stop:8974 length:753 start_codon:yes stop_codon:yes gene_type:complete